MEYFLRHASQQGALYPSPAVTTDYQEVSQPFSRDIDDLGSGFPRLGEIAHFNAGVHLFSKRYQELDRGVLGHLG